MFMYIYIYIHILSWAALGSRAGFSLPLALPLPLPLSLPSLFVPYLPSLFVPYLFICPLALALPLPLSLPRELRAVSFVYMSLSICCILNLSLYIYIYILNNYISLFIFCLRCFLRLVCLCPCLGNFARLDFDILSALFFARTRRLRESPRYLFVVLPGKTTISANLRNSSAKTEQKKYQILGNMQLG